MSKDDGVRSVETIEELVNLVSLSEIRPFEIRAVAKAPVPDVMNDVSFDLQYAMGDAVDSVVDRFQFTAESDDATYYIDIGAIFSFDEALTVPESIRIDFAQRISFMTLFPYIRESITTSAGRLGRPSPLLDLMRPGDMQIQSPQES